MTGAYRLSRKLTGWHRICAASSSRPGSEGHTTKSEAPSRMAVTAFSKPTSSIVGPGGPIVLPKVSKHVDFECELCAVIGTRSRKLSEENAYDAIFGYTIFNDISARDAQAVEMGGMLGPAKMPNDIVQRLSRDIVASINTKDVTDRMLNEGTVPTPSTPEEFTAYITSELKKWGDVIKAAKIKIE